MAGTVKLFERNAQGLLVEVAPAQADALRTSRPFSSVNLVVDVLWTDAEIAQRQAEEQAAALEAAASQVSVAMSPEQKLAAIGLTVEDLKALLS